MRKCQINQNYLNFMTPEHKRNYILNVFNKLSYAPIRSISSGFVIVVIPFVPQFNSKCLLHPYNAPEVLNSKSEPQSQNKVISSSEQEHCNPLFAKS